MGNNMFNVIVGFIWALLICSIITMFFGCRNVKYIPFENLENVTTNVRHEIVTLKDTVYIKIPFLTAERTTRDSSSHLENEFAESDARINKDGTLFHDLKTKTQEKKIPIEKTIERNDSIVNVEKKVEVPIPVERELSIWEKVCVKWFPYILLIAFIELIFIFRKPVFAWVRRFI